MEFSFDGPLLEDNTNIPAVFVSHTNDAYSNGLNDKTSVDATSSVVKRNRSVNDIGEGCREDDEEFDEGAGMETESSMHSFENAHFTSSSPFSFSSSSSSSSSSAASAMTLGVRKKVCVAKRRKVQKEPLEELEAFLDPSIENDPEYQQLTSDVQRVQYQKFVEHSHKLFTDEYESQLTAAIFFRSILASNRYDPLDSVLEKGIASRIIFLLKTSHDMRLRNELLWSITNIACGEPHQTKILFEEGCVDLLVDIIAESPQRHAEQAIWAMGNVVTNHSASVLMLCESRLLETLLSRLGLDDAHTGIEFPSLQAMKHCSWIVLSFCRVVVTPAIQSKFTAMVLALSVLIQSPDHELLADVCTAVCELCDNSPMFVQQMMELGFVGRLVQLATLPAIVNVLKRVAPLQHEPIPIRMASIKALVAILRVCNPIQSLALLLPKHALLEKITCELLDDNIEDNDYRKDILCALAVTVCRDHKYSERFARLDPIIVGLTKMLKIENEVVFKSASKLLGAMIINGTANSINVRGGNLVLSVVYKLVEGIIVNMLRVEDIEIKILGLRILEISFKNGYYGPVLRQNIVLMEQLENVVGCSALHPDASIAEASKYIYESFISY